MDGAARADVFTRVASVEGELELIRARMGKSGASAPLIRVRDAAPREVYFQAQTLFHKANWLATELTGNRQTCQVVRTLRMNRNRPGMPRYEKGEIGIWPQRPSCPG